MSDFFYQTVRAIGGAIFWVSSRPSVLHAHRTQQPCGYILASNHHSYLDVPCLVAATPRIIDWLSILELFQNPLLAWFLRSMGAFPLDRTKPDPATVRLIVRRLRQGRVVGVFPEAGLRAAPNAIYNGGEFDPGVIRLALMARAPILPCVILGSKNFYPIRSWLPLRRTRFAVIYGNPIPPKDDLDRPAAIASMARELQEAFRSLHAELSRAWNP